MEKLPAGVVEDRTGLGDEIRNPTCMSGGQPWIIFRRGEAKKPRTVLRSGAWSSTTRLTRQAIIASRSGSWTPHHPHSLRPDVDMLLKDGSGMSPRLRAAVETLARVPLDDCVCEGPHAQAKRIKMPAAAAKWAWVAASMRLTQNLEDCRGALEVHSSAAFRSAWTAWATVVQPAEKSRRFPKMKPKELRRRLYRLDHLLGFHAGASVAVARAQALEDQQHAGALAIGTGVEEDRAHLVPEQARRAPETQCRVWLGRLPKIGLAIGKLNDEAYAHNTREGGESRRFTGSSDSLVYSLAGLGALGVGAHGRTAGEAHV